MTRSVLSFDPEVPAGSFVGDGYDDRLRLSDVGKLARRTRRRIVGAARVEDRVTFEVAALESYETQAAELGAAIQEAYGEMPTVSVVRFVAGPTRLYQKATFSGVCPSIRLEKLRQFVSGPP